MFNCQMFAGHFSLNKLFSPIIANSKLIIFAVTLKLEL